MANRNVISRVMANILGIPLTSGVDLGNGYYDFGEMPTDYSAFSFKGETPNTAAGNNPLGRDRGTPTTTGTPPPGGAPHTTGADFGPFPPWHSQPTPNPLGRPTGFGGFTIPGLGQQAGQPNPLGTGSNTGTGLGTGGNGIGRGMPVGGAQQKGMARYNYGSSPSLANNYKSTGSSLTGNTFRGSFRRRSPGSYMGY